MTGRGVCGSAPSLRPPHFSAPASLRRSTRARSNATPSMPSTPPSATPGPLHWPVEQDLSDRLVRPYADTVVTQSEDDIGPVQDSFGSVDPPTEADEKLRDHVGGLLSDAGDALAAARIALRNDDRAGMARSVRNLRSVAAEMERTSERLS